MLDVLADGRPTGSPGPTLMPGDAVAFTYRITNTGGETLWSPYVWHDGIGGAACPIRRIDAGATVECTGTGTVEAGATSALATAQAWAADGAEVSASRTVHLVGGPAGDGFGITLAVTADGMATDLAPGPGLAGTVSYEYAVANTGSDDLWALTIWHDGVGEVPCADRWLAPGATVVCEFDAPARHGVAGVTAWAWDGAGSRSSASATVFSSVAEVAPVLALSMEAAVAGSDADA
ncbi:MAG: hypothetical protein GWN79_03565, partial [Actinobacteria bacterium]|nr:hypothetical protein [Actinomycetota bacterium]